MSYVEQLTATIQGQLDADLREVAKLEQALAALNGSEPEQASANGTAPRGVGRAKVLQLVADNPGIKTGELAKAIGSTHAWTLVKQLAASGEIQEHDGGGWQSWPAA